MRAVLVAAPLIAALVSCRYDLDDYQQTVECEISTRAPTCIEAAENSVDDYDWLQANIFNPNCGTDSCHERPVNGQPPGGGLVLTGTTANPNPAYDSLMGPPDPANGNMRPGVPSDQDPNHKLIVPGDTTKSYLLYIMKGVPKEDGVPRYREPSQFMPAKNDTLCCQKLEAMRRWIEAGAPGPSA